VTTDENAPFPPMVYRQDIRVDSGVGYGVIGADMHVFGDGVPLYLLENWSGPPEADPAWLRELPSRLLNARFEVVDFTGRGSELGQLHEWRRGGPRLAVRWLHGPAGAGKTRLAAKFASESLADSWKVVTATLGPGVLLPVLDSQDLRPDSADGLLLIVDYADRWPATALVTLLSNRLLRHRSVRTRILMVARAADDWPAIQRELTGERPAFSSRLLELLPEDSPARMEMFAAALAGFARHYGVAGVSGLRPPGPLEQADFALTLAVHMAALVTVDAHVSGRRAPSDMASLTVYLLDRENHHWAQLYGDGTHELNPGERTFRTPPAVLRRVVFTAALTGPVDRATGIAILERLVPELPDQDQALSDHATCYPPASPNRADALEPLYPDRLTEDFIALTIPDLTGPGHGTDYPDQPWAWLDTQTLLARLISEDLGNLRIPNARLSVARRRAVIFLASAALRWPHVATDALFPLLRMFPQLAVAAGGPVLTVLAQVGGPGPLLDDELLTVLEKIDRAIPFGSDLDLNTGADHLAERIARHYLHAGGDPAAEVSALLRLFSRIRHAGRAHEALAAAEQTLAIARPLAESDSRYLTDLAFALDNVGTALSDLSRSAEALAPTSEAADICRRLAAANPAELPRLVVMLNSLGDMQSVVGHVASYHSPGQVDDAVASLEEAIAISRRLLAESGPEHLPILAKSLLSLGRHYANSGRIDAALTASTESIGIYRRLVADYPKSRFLSDLGDALIFLGNRLAQAGRLQEALPYADEAVQLYRGLAESYPGRHLPQFAVALSNLCAVVSEEGDPARSLPLIEEAAAITGKIAKSGDPLALMGHGFALNNLAATLLKLDRPVDAVPVAQEAVDSLQRASELGVSAGASVDLIAHAVLAKAIRESRGGSKGKKWFRRQSAATPAPAPPSSDSRQPVRVDRTAAEMVTRTARTSSGPSASADDEAEILRQFSSSARRAVALAYEEAMQLNHNIIADDHILLGLIAEGGGPAARALDSLGISLESARNAVEEIWNRGLEAPSGHIPLTPLAVKVLKLSVAEAASQGHDVVGTEHLMLALIRDGGTAKVMERLGVDPAAVGQRLAHLLRPEQGEALESAPADPDAAGFEAP
jgi:tetratricopeptide (TPR) repeat protein